jgi:hypothetical protein
MDVITTSIVANMVAYLAKPQIIEAIRGIANQLSKNHPVTLMETQIAKLTAADRRISMGLTKRDGAIAMALLVEKPESLAERKAENMSAGYEGAVIPMVTGVAHSSRADQPSRTQFERHVGTSVGHIRGSPGSVGCLVNIKSRSTNYLALTSAAHVLSMLNRAEEGDPILFPGHPDGPNVLGNKVGTLANFTYLNHYSDNENWADLTNHEDIAVVKLEDPDKWPAANLVPNPKEASRRKKISEIVKKSQTLDYVGKKVFKAGRTSALTQGLLEVAAIGQFGIRLPDGRMYMYRDLLAIKGDGDRPFSLPGDSGALVYTEDFKALGFVVGGSETFSFACGAEQCLESVNATLVP